ncbi:MAG: proteasome subunit alpha [Acidimicrobiia bacterium]
MTFPFYVSPEQLTKDKAEFARKGIARGRSLVALGYKDGILIAAENPSRALRKISEVYDRIAFAAVGRYNEFEALRVMGIRLADMTGYSNSREDVNGRALANVYAQQLGTIFTTEPKPYEVELLLAEIGDTPDKDSIYHVLYDGSLQDEKGYAVIGGNAELVASELEEKYQDGQDLQGALRIAARALDKGDTSRKLDGSDLEVAVLDRTVNTHRKFRRLRPDEIASLLGDVLSK